MARPVGGEQDDLWLTVADGQHFYVGDDCLEGSTEQFQGNTE
jgi:hypothetical protein